MGGKKSDLLKTKQKPHQTQKNPNHNATKSESTKRREDVGWGAGGFRAENMNKCYKGQSKETHTALK